MGFFGCLSDPLLDLAGRHLVGPPSRHGRFINGHVYFIAAVAPAHAGIAEYVAQFTLKQGDHPPQPGSVTDLTLNQLVQGF